MFSGARPATAAIRLDRLALGLLGWMGVLGGLLLACLSGAVAGALHLQQTSPEAPCDAGVLRGTVAPARSPFGDSLVYGRVRILATTGGRQVTWAEGTLGAPRARIDLDEGGSVDVELEDPTRIGQLNVETRSFARFEDIPAPPRNVTPLSGAELYEVRLWPLREGDPLMRCARADGSHYFVRSARAERDAGRAQALRLGRLATLGAASGGALMFVLALGLGALLSTRARRLRALDARSTPATYGPPPSGAMLEGPAFGPTPLDALPEPFASYGAALRAGHVPPEHRAFFGAPGPTMRYLGAVLPRMLGGAAALGGLALVAAGICLAAERSGLARGLFAVSGLALLTSPLLALRYVALRRQVARLEERPGEHALAFGPEGILITMHHLGVPKMAVVPYRDTLDARLLARHAFAWELAWGASWRSSLAPGDLDGTAPRVLQELRLAHRLLSLGQRVTAEAMAALARQEATALSASAGAPQAGLEDLARRTDASSAPLGVWVLPWSRPPERAASRVVLMLALALPLVTLLPAVAGLFYLLFARGRRDGHQLVWLPDTLLVCEDRVRVVPLHTIQRIEERRGGLVLHTTAGVLTIDAGYGLTRAALASPWV